MLFHAEVKFFAVFHPKSEISSPPVGTPLQKHKQCSADSAPSRVGDSSYDQSVVNCGASFAAASADAATMPSLLPSRFSASLLYSLYAK
jgi:hypothetical protein